MTREARTILILAAIGVAAVVVLSLMAGKYERALAARPAAAPAVEVASPSR